MKLSTPPVFGIIGGLGPAASSHFLQQIIRAAQRHGASSDASYPQLVLSSRALPDFGPTGEPSPAAAALLCTYCQQLQHAGATTLVSACNSIQPLLQGATSLPILHPADIAGQQYGQGPVGVIGSAFTRQQRLYDKYFQHPVRYITQQQQTVITDILARAMAHQHTSADIQTLQTFADTLRYQGAKHILLGCTELSYLHPELPEYFVDPLSLLADHIVKLYNHERTHHASIQSPGCTATHGRAARHIATVPATTRI